jgi:UrcA family protein
MSAQTSSRSSIRFLRTSALVAVAAGLVLAGAAQAQPYDDGYYDQSAPAPGYANGVTVMAPDRYDRDGVGDRITASRVVDVSDLDLNTGWGLHRMHDRVQRAAVQVCRELDDRVGGSPLQPNNDRDCVHRAVRRALASAQVGDDVDADYTGY